MAIDGIFLHHLVNELKILETGRISKIKQLANQEMLFVIRANRVNYQLVVSASPEYARIHLSDNDYESDLSIPNFLMVMRKFFDGSIIKSIEQVGADRVIVITVNKNNELGDRIERKIYLEIMGKHSNITLVEDGKIIDAIKRVPPFQNSYRTLLPGFQYKLPVSKELNPFEGLKIIDFDQLMNYQGISPVLANELILKNDSSIINQKVDPVIIKEKRENFYFFPLTNWEVIKRFDTLSELLDEYFFNRNSTEKIKQRAKDLTIFIKKELEKNKNKLLKLYDDLNKAENSEEYRVKGEVLLANIHEISRGLSKITLTNFYNNEPIEIQLDIRKSPQLNAKAYFQRYNKAKNAISHLHKQIEETKIEIEYFELLTVQIKDATINDVDEIRGELEDKKYLKRKTKKRNKKPNFKKYIVDGTEILVGRNNLQNEYITHKLAQKYDLWFHAKDIPGSHVLVKNDNPSEDVIRAAANLAAYYSKAKTSNSVPVDYTFIRYIKKVPGRDASFVTYTNQKTIYIDPEPNLIKSYKNPK